MEKQPERNLIFSPLIITWLITIFFGLMLPLFGQGFIAEQISHLSLLPSTITEVTQAVDPKIQAIASVVLFSVLALYLTGVSFQIFFVAKTLQIGSVLALALTLVSPFFIWFTLPYILIASL